MLGLERGNCVQGVKVVGARVDDREEVTNESATHSLTSWVRPMPNTKMPKSEYTVELRCSGNKSEGRKFACFELKVP